MNCPMCNALMSEPTKEYPLGKCPNPDCKYNYCRINREHATTLTETDHLVLQERVKIEQFDYIIKDSNNLSCGDGVITIKFKNEKFDSAHYPFNATYNRDQWKILVEIENIISNIEATMEKNNG
jgi:hypothetical protein